MVYSEKSSNGRSPQETVDRALRGTSSYDSTVYRPGPPMLPAPIPALPPEERSKIFDHLKKITETLEPAVEYEPFTFIKKGPVPVPTTVFESGQSKATPEPETEPQTAETISEPEPTHIEPMKEKVLGYSNDFIRGFAMNLPKPREVIWQNAKHLLFLSTTKKQSERNLTKGTIGTIGKTIDSPTELRMYFPTPAFIFLSEEIDDNIFEDKSRFAPFVLGILMFLSEKENRISSHDIENLKRIPEKFEEHFGFSMGSFVIEKRKERKDNGIIAVPDKKIKKVFEALLKEPEVKSLPFLPSVVNSLREKVPTLFQGQGI